MSERGILMSIGGRLWADRFGWMAALILLVGGPLLGMLVFSLASHYETELASAELGTYLEQPRTWLPVLLGTTAFLLWESLTAFLIVVTRRGHEESRRHGSRVVRAALSSLTEGVIVADLHGRFLLFNDAAERILGIGLVDADPAQWSLVYGCFRADKTTPYPPHELPLARAIAGVATTDIEVFIRNRSVPDGIWLSIDGAPLQDEQGAMLGGVVTFRDVTARKKAEVDLKDSVRQLEEIRWAIEQTADSVFITNRDGIIEYVNPGFEATTGYLRHEVIGQTPRLLKSGQYDAEHYRRMWSTILNGQVYRGISINRRKNGDLFHAEQTISPMKDAAGQVTRFVSVVKDITDELKKREREIEMEVAARLQRRLYPELPLVHERFDIAGMVSPAAATGGDYFDYVQLADGCVAIAVGDVCGHGLASALIMAETRAYVRSFIASCSEPAAILVNINRLLHDDLQHERHYVTLFLGRLDATHSSLAYASAGHPPGFVLGSKGEMKAALGSTGIPLGMFPEAAYHGGREHALAPGDTLVLLTDGITDAESPAGQIFEGDRALDVVRAHLDEPAAAIVERVRDAVHAFCGDGARADDVTVLVCKVRR